MFLPLLRQGEEPRNKMKIQPRYYPYIIIITYLVFLLIGILLGFGPERIGGSHGNNMLIQLALALESLT